jgi:tetratricopeptide (TPR) repeat protein
MHRQVLGLRETALGKEHPSTLTSMNNLAGVLRDQGKYEEAEEMYRQALRLRMMVLGKKHPSTLTSMNDLAGVLNDQGKYKEAEDRYPHPRGPWSWWIGQVAAST